MRYMALRSLVLVSQKAHRHAWELQLEDEFLASDPLQWSPALIRAFELMAGNGTQRSVPLKMRQATVCDAWCIILMLSQV